MNYDLIIVGGGLAGSTLGGRLAQSGLKVLILEQESEFRDRVRGENMHPWGAAAAARIGILKTLETAGGNHAPWIMFYLGGNPIQKRDYRVTTPVQQGAFNIYHPQMQEALLQHAIQCGAEVKRGAVVANVESGPGRAPEVTFTFNGQNNSEKARVVVGADGRQSKVRSSSGFEIKNNPDILTVAGLLLENCRAPEDTTHLLIGAGYCCLIAPLGREKARVYIVYPSQFRWQLSGKHKIPEFIRWCRETNLPPEWLADAQAAGPLAEFPGADRWVDEPTRDGIVLIGDAAASSDPSWGCGLSQTLLDVENLSNKLLAAEDWSLALKDYAKEHDVYSTNLRHILDWMTELIYTPGAEAQARRERVFSRLFSDPTGFPDHNGQGPFGPCDEKAKRLILGMD